MLKKLENIEYSFYSIPHIVILKLQNIGTVKIQYYAKKKCSSLLK